MAYRRVVRADEKSSEISEIQKPEKSTHVCNSFFRCLYRVVSVLWKCIKTLWYWTERFILVGLLFGLTTGLAWWLSQKPSLYRDWEDMDAVLPTISWSGNSVTIDNIRNHTWSSSKDFVPSYFTENYNIDTITGLTYIITPFSDSDGPAHTMFLFSFSGGKDIIISPEVRKERGESFSAFL